MDNESKKLIPALIAVFLMWFAGVLIATAAGLGIVYLLVRVIKAALQ